MANTATQVKNMRILLRRDVAINWETINPLLLKGESGIETDEKGMKIGDGVSRWNDLPYFVGFETLDGGSPAGYVAQEVS